MRFSTVAASAILIGFAAALPNNVVYETEMVTITSCAPDKSDCPYASPTPTPVEPTPVYPEVTTTPCPTSTEVSVPPHYPNSTVTYPQEPVPEYPEESEYPTPEYPEPTPENQCPGGYDCPPPYVPTGTGVPYPPANTSSPSVPSSPPEYEGAAVKMGASLIAVAGAAVIALLV
jgi:hypothetical protein